jgi:hypothetical protein
MAVIDYENQHEGQTVLVQYASYIGIKVINIFITKHMIDYVVNSTNVTSAAVCVTGM